MKNKDFGTCSLSIIEIIDTQVARRGRQYHSQPGYKRQKLVPTPHPTRPASPLQKVKLVPTPPPYPAQLQKVKVSTHPPTSHHLQKAKSSLQKAKS